MHSAILPGCELEGNLASPSGESWDYCYDPDATYDNAAEVDKKETVEVKEVSGFRMWHLYVVGGLLFFLFPTVYSSYLQRQQQRQRTDQERPAAMMRMRAADQERLAAAMTRMRATDQERLAAAKEANEQRIPVVTSTQIIQQAAPWRSRISAV